MNNEERNLDGIIDIHCHIIPGVDDGAETRFQVRELLKMEYESGVRALILTPHHRRGMFEADRETVIKRASYVRDEIQNLKMDMKLYLGCEYHANSDMIEELRDNPHFRINGSNYVLAEFSSAHSFAKIRNWIYQLVTSGFVPIVAHIERYPAVDCLEKVEELLNLGALMQVDAGAILGEYGFRQKQMSWKLLKKRMVHFVASDAHDTEKKRPNLKECAVRLERKLGRSYAEELLVQNPQKILEKTH